MSHISAVLVKYLRIAVDAAKEQPPHDEFVVMCRNYRGASRRRLSPIRICLPLPRLAQDSPSNRHSFV